MSSTTTINMVTNSNTNLHKVNTNTNNALCTPSSTDTNSNSSTAIYIDDSNHTDDLSNDTLNATNDNGQSNISTLYTNAMNELSSIEHTTASHLPNSNKYQRFHAHQTSLFGHDYIKNFVILSKLYSPQEYYSNMTPIFNSAKYKGSDCPSDCDISSLDSHKSKFQKIKLKSRIRRLIHYIKYINNLVCDILKSAFEFLIYYFGKFQTWQKELNEAPIEVKEKYFFIVSTIVSTVLFYILFLCLDIMIKYWFALPVFITEYSFSISYCISYLTSVIWQHFFNQYFVFAVFNNNMTVAGDNNDFCDSLFRTYLVYGCSLLMTGVIGSLLQIYVGINDEFILLLTLPISGIMNYYLLRYCHKQQSAQTKYALLPTTNERKYHRSKTHHKTRHKSKRNLKKESKNGKKHKKAMDDIVIV